MGVDCANNCIVYNMMHPNDFTLLDFKIIVSTYSIGRYTGRSRAPLYHSMTKKDPKESTSISLSKITYHQIFRSFKIFSDDVNIATKNELT